MLVLDPHRLIGTARRWWWLLLLIPAIGAAAGYGISSRQQRMYSANAKLLISPAQSTGAFDYSALFNIDSLAETYREMIRTRPVLAPVVDELSLPYSVEELQTRVTTARYKGTLLFTVSVTDPDPRRAAGIANAIAMRFAAYIGERVAQLSGTSRSALDQQLTETKRQIDEISQQIQTIEQAPNAADPALQQELDSFRTRLDRLQQSYAELLLTAQTMDLNAAIAKDQVTIAEEAVPPTVPYAPRVAFATILAGFAGILLASGGIVFLAYLDNSVKIDTDFVALIGRPLLARIGRVPKLRHGRDQLYLLNRPNSGAADAIRTLRTNLGLTGALRANRCLAISSPRSAEGKSTIMANLAVAVAQTGLSTVLIDTDLRNPCQHRIFGVANEHGLTTLLRGDWQSWHELAFDSGVANLTLIPSGPPPPIPVDLLSLDSLRQLLAQISNTVDVVLLDTAPVLLGSDALVVGTVVDDVILVARANQTRIDALQSAVATLQLHAVRIVGIVLNQQTGGHRGRFYPAQVMSRSNGAVASQTESQRELLKVK